MASATKPIWHRTVAHLRSLGLSVVCGDERIPQVTPFFSNGGTWIDRGVLYVRPTYADIGEFLHEAGPLALTPRRQWRHLSGNVDNVRLPFGNLYILADMAVEAWDYAIAHELQINPCHLFMQGFEGAGWQVWESFEEGTHPGFAMLQALGMSSEFGQLNHHLIGDRALQDGEGAVRQFMAVATQQEAKGLVAIAEKMRDRALEKTPKIPLVKGVV